MVKFDHDTLQFIYDYGDLGTWMKFSEIIEEKKSDWQTIMVARHDKLGKVLLLGEDLMGSEFDDEYDKAVIHLIPPETKRILILGGGDLSLASHLCKNENIEKIVVCDIDKEVFAISQKHFDVKLNERVKLVCNNAFDYLKEHDDYDLIIDDMITTPYKSTENYWKDLASKRKWVISQTDGENTSPVPNIAIEALLDIGAYVYQISHYVPTYTENWTFTKYKIE